MVNIKFLRHKFKIDFEFCEEEVLGMAVDVSEAKRRAKELYEKFHDVKESMISGNLATDLDRIIKNLNLRVFNTDMDELRKIADDGDKLDENTSGFLMRANGKHRIFVNKKDPMIRKRFTIAHEIGHLQLNHLGNEEKASTIFRDSTTSLGIDEKEVAANAFAAELLMPEDLTRYAYNLLKSVYKIARAFGVSEEMVRYRLKNLRIIDREW